MLDTKKEESKGCVQSKKRNWDLGFKNLRKATWELLEK